MIRSTGVTQAIQSPKEGERRLELFGASFLPTTLFLGDLSVLCSESCICELFGRYGELERVQLKRSDRDPQRAHLGFGFVKFVSRTSAERALEELNGRFFLGRALRVGWADENENRVASVLKVADPKKRHQTAQLHVSFMTSDLNRIVSEMDLGEVFGRFGNVVDIVVKKSFLNKHLGCQSGYAFIHFSLTEEGLESALAASEQVNNCMIANITYKCKTDQTLLNQHMFFKSYNLPANSRIEAQHPIISDIRSPLAHLCTPETTETRSKPVPTPFPLTFNTYERFVERPRLLDSNCSLPPTSQRNFVAYSPPISRSSSSLKKNHFPGPVLYPSISYDEYPHYQRGMTKDSYYHT